VSDPRIGTEWKQLTSTTGNRRHLFDGGGGFKKMMATIEIAKFPEFTDITDYFRRTDNLSPYRRFCKWYGYVFKECKGRVLVATTDVTDRTHNFANRRFT
jgi:hypothetical protein